MNNSFFSNNKCLWKPSRHIHTLDRKLEEHEEGSGSVSVVMLIMVFVAMVN